MFVLSDGGAVVVFYGQCRPTAQEFIVFLSTIFENKPEKSLGCQLQFF
jgi:hypothetical protein